MLLTRFHRRKAPELLDGSAGEGPEQVEQSHGAQNGGRPTGDQVLSHRPRP